MIRMIFNVEVSNHCDLRCYYCPHPKQKRPKGYMSRSTFEKVLDLHSKLKQRRIVLHNFGEPLLHPEILEFVKLASARLERVRLSTNAITFNPRMAHQLKSAGLNEITISNHSSHADKAAGIANLVGIPVIEVQDKFEHDWAGTAERHLTDFIELPEATDNNPRCAFLKNQWVTVLWNGDVTVCSTDSEGIGRIGSINDIDFLKRTTHPIELCKTCNKRFGI